MILKKTTLILFFVLGIFVFFALDSGLGALNAHAQAEGGLNCGEKVYPESYYEKASMISLAAGFGLLLLGVLIDHKTVKTAMIILATVPLIAWVYIHFGVDYQRLKRLAFTYNTSAESTLANIAEAQDRYKSEHDTYLKDLQSLYSHMAGAHGMDPCVKIIQVKATWNHWSAIAQHQSSPDKVTWSDKSGSSLKKG